MSQPFLHIDDAMLAKYLTGETTEAETAAVEVWLAADGANQKQFNDFETVWSQSLLAGVTGNTDSEAAWERFKERAARTKTAPVKSVNRFAWMRIAALFILIVGVSVIGYLLMQGSKTEQQINFTAKAEVREDTLSDGSVVTLNKNSSISYPQHFTGSTRPVSLKGEAFFKVAPDKQKPFLISVNDVTISVVGTSFNVRSYNSNTEVIVETGIVRVMKEGKIIELHKGERVSTAAKDPVLIKEAVDNRLYNYYRTKEFVCESTPLWQLVSVLNEAYGVHIVIGRKELAGLPLTTTFHNEPIEKILAVISTTFSITVVQQDGKYILQ